MSWAGLCVGVGFLALSAVYWWGRFAERKRCANIVYSEHRRQLNFINSSASGRLSGFILDAIKGRDVDEAADEEWRLTKLAYEKKEALG